MGITNEFDKIDQIVKEEDTSALFELEANDVFSIALHQLLINKHQINPNTLTEPELNLFICMHLENAGQADSILSFLQEWHPEYAPLVTKGLKDIGAIKSSEIIKKALTLIPEDGTWFYENATEEEEELMDKFDGEFSDYPDGFLCNLFRSYAERNKERIL